MKNKVIYKDIWVNAYPIVIWLSMEPIAGLVDVSITGTIVEKESRQDSSARGGWADGPHAGAFACQSSATGESPPNQT